MLVQTCPAPASTLGSYSGAASYCGLTVSAQSETNYADTNNVISDRVTGVPIVLENTCVASDANGNRQLIKSNKRGPDTSVNNSDNFDDNSFESVDTKDNFLKIDTDTIETESQMLNIETTITETFTINSNEIVDDIVSELIQSQPNENSSDNHSVSNHSLNESEVVEQQSIHTVRNIDVTPVSYDFYSQNFERAFQLESTGNVPISSVSPSLSSDSSLCQKVLRSRESSPTLNENKRDFERDSDTRSYASLDRGSSDTDEVQKKSCLDKSAKAKEVFSSPDGEKSSGHRVTFNDKNEVASQDKDGKFKVTYRQLGEKIKNHAEFGEHKNAALKVQYGEKSRLESVPISPRTLNFNDSTFDVDMNQTRDSCESTELPEEWDNPFQPEGEVSQDADLILQLWKGGKLNEENLEENLKILAAAGSADNSIDNSPEHSNHKGQNGFTDKNGVNNVMNNEDKNGVNGDKGVNGVNGVNSANGFHLVSNSKPGSPKNNTSQIPVSNNMKENNSDMTYTVVLSDKQKHKNKIKKHCNMM